MAEITTVRFLGGALDGQIRTMQDNPSVHKVTIVQQWRSIGEGENIGATRGRFS